MIIIPLFIGGRIFKASGEASTEVDVKCEECGFRYYYEATRSVEVYVRGSADSREGQKRAQKQIDEKLDTLLKNAVDIVPCPKCGHYQKNMVPLVRWTYYRFLVWIAVGCLIAAAASYLGAILTMDHAQHEPMPTWSKYAFIIFPTVGVLAFGAWWGLTSMADPNKEDKKARIKLGRKNAQKR
ncbi:MAG: hypothetical protein R3C18_24295 [Planctomycetaceae bacterium]